MAAEHCEVWAVWRRWGDDRLTVESHPAIKTGRQVKIPDRPGCFGCRNTMPIDEVSFSREDAINDFIAEANRKIEELKKEVADAERDIAEAEEIR